MAYDAYRLTGKIYCRSMISGSALSGTRRHWALSSASNCQVSPLADINTIWPRSSRHCVGANAATAGSHFGFRKTWKLSPARLGVGQGQAADRLAVAAHHRPVADHLVHRFRQRARGGEILQDVDALAGPQALENPGLDFGEVDHRLAGGILQPHDIAETP